MARARVVDTFHLEKVGAWAVRVADLEGIIRIGDDATFKLAHKESSLLTVTGLGLGSRSGKPAGSTVDLLIRGGIHLGLDRFTGGTVETTDLP